MNYISIGDRFINLDNVISLSLRKRDDEYIVNDEDALIEGEGSYVLSISVTGGFHNIHYGIDDSEANEIWNILRNKTNATHIK